MLELLTTSFRQLLSMALTALPVMAAVLLVRALLGKAPRKYAYALWLVVAFRLVCPVTLPESALSLFNLKALAPVAEHTVEVGARFSAVTPLPAPPPAGGMMSQPMPDLAGPPAAGGSIITPIGGPTPAEIALTATALLWVAGLLVLAAWGIRSYLRLRRQVSTAVRREEGVWECDGIPTPFVLGLFRPNIYIPFRLSDGERTYVLAHERHHIARRDHWTKPLALLILAVYWWDPAVWLCWVLYCRDMEMSCDEAVLARLGNEVKADYSRSLVSFALDRSLPTALAFGEHDATRRVRNILDWQRAKPRVTFLAICAVVLTLVVCGTGAQDDGTWLRREKPDFWSTSNYSYSVPDADSFVIYRETYEYGVLTDRTSLVYGDFGNVTPRKGTFTIQVEQDFDRDDVLNWSLGQMKTGERKENPDNTIYFVQTVGGEGTWTFVPSYQGPLNVPEGSGKKQLSVNNVVDLGDSKLKLKPTADIALQVYTFHEKNAIATFGPILCTDFNDGDPAELLADVPYAIVIRVRLSPFVADMNLKSVEWGSNDLARQLYALRAEEVTEEAVAEILALLGETTPITLEQGGYPLDPEALVVCYAAKPASGFAAMELTALLPALFEDVERIVYGYQNNSGGTVYEEAYSPNSKYMDLTELAQLLGYADIKELGCSVEGIRAMVDYMVIPQRLAQDAAPWGAPTTDELAETLFALRTDSVKDTAEIEAILNALGVSAERTIRAEGAGTIVVEFTQLISDDDAAWDTLKAATPVLLALVEDAETVEFCTRVEGETLKTMVTQAGKSDGLQSLKSLGRSVASIQRLLEKLAADTPDTAPVSLPIRLHTLRTGSMKNQANVRAILSALGADGLGSFTVKAYSGGELRVDFTDRPADAIPESPVVDNAMWTYAHFLLALVEDAETVSWFYPSNGSGMGHAFERSEADARAKALGYKDIKALGLTTQGILDLASYLHMDQSHGRTLYDMRLTTANDVQGVKAILRYLGVPACELSWPNHQGTLTLIFPEEPAELDALLRPVTGLLLALVEDLEQVDWTYPGPDGPRTIQMNANASDFHAQTLGYADIKAVGQSPEAIQRFLDHMRGTITQGTDHGVYLPADADFFFTAAQESSQSMVLAEYLLRSGPWPLPEDADYTLTETEDALEFRLTAAPADPDALDTALARSAMILLDLRPWVDTVRWSWPDGEARTFDRERDMAGIIGLSSNTAIFTERPSDTHEALDRLMTYVDGIDGKLYRSMARDTFGQQP